MINDETTASASGVLTPSSTICPEWANLKPHKTTVVIQLAVTHASVVNYRAPKQDIQIKFRRDMPLGILVKRLRRKYHSSQDHVLRWADPSQELEIFDSDTPDNIGLVDGSKLCFVTRKGSVEMWDMSSEQVSGEFGPQL